MFGVTRWNSFDDVFNFQREMDRSSTSSGTNFPLAPLRRRRRRHPRRRCK